MAIDITKIPGIMRGNAMPIGAKLMESWFLRPSAIKPAVGTPDLSTIKMSWVVRFKRAKAVFDDIVTNKIWFNAPARKVIEDKLKAKGLLGSVAQNFGDLSQSPTILDAEQINQRAVGMSSMTESLDDLDAALANFVFQVVIAGSVSPKGKGHQVDIKEVGIFVRDSYDFEGGQYLGTWDDVKNTVSRNPAASGEAVYNSTFRDWRTKNGMGGDYMIFSDVHKITLSPADTFDIMPVSVPPFRWEPGPKW